MPPAVSVVLPAYNGERFVRDAVQSILRQTFTDLELIVVDDASSDGTPAILADLAAADPRMTVHRHPRNRGFREALNTGCRLARAPLVAKMAHDDISLPARLERQVAFLNAHPEVGVVGTAVRIIDASGRPSRTKRYPARPGHVAWSMLFFNAIVHPSVVIRRELLDAESAYPAGCQGGTEDYALFSALSRSSQVANLDEVLLHYRAWPGSMTSTLWERQERDALRIASALAASWGVTMDGEDVSVLRGLSLGRYPSAADQIERAAEALIAWTSAVALDPRWSPADRATIRREAGARLWLLSGCAGLRRPRLAASLARAAVRMAPTSAVTFVARAARVAVGHAKQTYMKTRGARRA